MNEIILIIGRMWSWKTLISVCLSENYLRVYANLKIIKKWKQKNFYIEKIEDIKKIKYSKTRWLVILDEAGLNMNARRSQSKNNMDITEFIILSRKRNLDLIFISQKDFFVDKNLRELAQIKIEMKWKNREWIFEYEAKDFYDNFLWYYNLDLIWFLKNNKLEYNTLEDSLI